MKNAMPEICLSPRGGMDPEAAPNHARQFAKSLAIRPPTGEAELFASEEVFREYSLNDR
jgi:hypothetical protein